MSLPKINTDDQAAIQASTSLTLDGEIEMAKTRRDEAMERCLHCSESEKRQAEENMHKAAGYVIGLLAAKSLTN